MSVNRIPIENSDKQLVIVNLHLEAYDSGEGKIAQTNMLADILRTEAEAGNYVIAAGDFNQAFSGTDTSARAAGSLFCSFDAVGQKALLTAFRLLPAASSA